MYYHRVYQVHQMLVILPIGVSVKIEEFGMEITLKNTQPKVHLSKAVIDDQPARGIVVTQTHPAQPIKHSQRCVEAPAHTHHAHRRCIGVE